MEISPRKPSKRAQEPVDEWLQNEGYFRKHTPKDPTCLFRAVSEQIYMTQHYHIRVRMECVQFMKNMRHLFEEHITIPLENYLDQMSCFTEWGGRHEIQAMSLLYKRDVMMFNGQKQTRKIITDNGFNEMLYFCYTPQKQYESVYTKNFISAAAYCQSIAYHVLYKDVFNMHNIDHTVHRMLHDRNTTFRHEKFFLKGNLEMREQLTDEIYNKVQNEDEVDDASSSVKETLPFPYRIAKALDPNIYRNIDFDIWHEIRREVKNAGWSKYNTNELQIGGRCLIQISVDIDECDKVNNNVYVPAPGRDLNGNNSKLVQKKNKQYCGYIQEMSKNKGPVLVFIQELGEKRSVPYSALKPFPICKNKPTDWTPMCRKNIVVDMGSKWKKSCSVLSQKTKDPLPNLNILLNDHEKDTRNNNTSINSKRRGTFDFGQWTVGSAKQNQQIFDDYGRDKCINYAINCSGEMIAIANDCKESTTEVAEQEESPLCRESSITFINDNTADNAVNKTQDKLLAENSNQPFFYSQHKEEEESQLSYLGDNNTCSVIPYTSGNFGELIPAGQLHRILQSVNCSVQKSINTEGTDLPLSDLSTLRFFYNLGLECFRSCRLWSSEPNDQLLPLGPSYHGAVCADNESISNIDSNKTESNIQTLVNDSNLCTTTLQSSECGINDELQKNDAEKTVSHQFLDRTNQISTREIHRGNKNNLAPRFKKHSDRYRTSNQYHQQHTHNSNRCANAQYKGGSCTSTETQDSRNNGMHGQYFNPLMQQYISTGAQNSYHAAYMQPAMYAGMQFYGNEAEAFGGPCYLSNTGFLPITCVPHPDVPENNNFQLYPPHTCHNMDNYTQAYPPFCAPYIYPQQGAYSNVPAPNVQDRWYSVQGQPHYFQYAHIPPNSVELTNNTAGPNGNPNTSP